MAMNFVILLIVALTAFGYIVGRRRALACVNGNPQALHSLPSYYGYFVAIWCGLPALLIVLLFSVGENDLIHHLLLSSLPPTERALPPERLQLLFTQIRNAADHDTIAESISPALAAAAERYESLRVLCRAALVIVVVSVGLASLMYARGAIIARLSARYHVERVIVIVLALCSTIAILTTIGIVLSLIFEAWRFFVRVPPWDFLFGLQWSPQIAMRADQVGATGAFGAIPLFVGTLLIAAVAMAVAMPVGLMSAIYMAEYAPNWIRATAKPLLEILAGIPTVVYGFFAALTVSPFFHDTGEFLGLNISSESALAVGVVMGVMLIPFVSSLSDDVIMAVPQSMREGSLGLGATRSETIRKVVVPAALPGIVGGFLLAVSRAIGETMIVVMAAGLSANLPKYLNPLEAVTTVTVQIATLLVGDQEFDSSKTLAAFALGLVLFFATLALNVVALRIVKRYREQYE